MIFHILKIKKFIKSQQLLVLSFVFFSLFSGAVVVFATPPGSPYSAGDTLDPSCAPGDTNCYVAGASGASTALSNLASVAINTSLISDTYNTDALGSSAIAWSDLYLGNGAVIDFSSAASTSDVTITHSANLLTIVGGDLTVPTLNAGTSIELSHASDNTLTASSGILSIEGVAIPTISSTSTLTNKTIDDDSNTITNIDGENIKDDTIDDDSIDFIDVTLSDLTFDVGSVSTTEFGYLDGVTSAIQTQLNTKGTLSNLLEDTTPQLGGSLDINSQKIVSTSNGNIDIEPNGTGNVLLGNFTFDADQTVGAGQDNYIFTYDHGTGLISLEVSASSGASTALSNLASVAINTSLISDTYNTDALGSSAIAWSDLYLGNGAVIDFSSAASTSDVTITHSANTLTFAGGTIALGTATATGGITGNLTGNASTATALASNPSDCGTYQFATAIAASGNLTCSSPSVIPNYIMVMGTINATTGNTSTNVNMGIFSQFIQQGYAVDGQKAYFSYMMYDDLSDQEEFARMTWEGIDVSNGTRDGQFNWAVITDDTLLDKLSLNGLSLFPSTSNDISLGTSSKMWSDLYLASGAVIDFNNGDVLLTHGSDNLALSGGSFSVSTDLASNYAGTFFNDGNSDNRYGISIQAGADTPSAGIWIQFNDGDGTDQGSICYTGGQANVCAPSDLRLKENIIDTDLSLDLLRDIKVRDFSYTSDENQNIVHGFVAQELYEIYPDAVSIPESEDMYWKVSYAQLTPLIVKSIQDLDIKVSNIENLGINSNFITILKSWLGDVANGISKIYATVIKGERVETSELCIDDICINRNQLEQLLNGQSISVTYSSDNSNDNNPDEVIDDISDDQADNADDVSQDDNTLDDNTLDDNNLDPTDDTSDTVENTDSLSQNEESSIEESNDENNSQSVETDALN